MIDRIEVTRTKVRGKVFFLMTRWRKHILKSERDSRKLAACEAKVYRLDFYSSASSQPLFLEKRVMGLVSGLGFLV